MRYQIFLKTPSCDNTTVSSAYRTGPQSQSSLTKDSGSRSASVGGSKSDAGKVREEDDDVVDNHTVIATAKGVFTSAGGLLDSPGDWMVARWDGSYVINSDYYNDFNNDNLS